MPVVVANGLKPKPKRRPADKDGDRLRIRKRAKKPNKRQREARGKFLSVAGAGEAPKDLVLKNGRVLQFDLLRGKADNESIPRRQREFMARMNLSKSDGIGNAPGEKEKELGKRAHNDDRITKESRQTTPSGPARKPETGNTADAAPKKARKSDPMDGIKPGESIPQYSARLKEESRRMMIAIGRKGNHQREKKKAYYEKRRQRLEEKKKRRRGDLSESDVEEDEDDTGRQEISKFPMYWQEILRNNGRPVSVKRQKRISRKERRGEEQDNVRFGEQVERPPQLSVLPVRRGKARE